MPLTMSSREIAELCVKPHQQVCLDIEKLDAHYTELGLPKIERSNYIQEDNGLEQREYHLSQEQTLDLVTGYAFDMRIKVKVRMVELGLSSASDAYHEVQRLQRERREAAGLLKELDNDKQLLRKVEEARQKAFTHIGSLYGLDRRMMTKDGGKSTTPPEIDSVKLWNKMVAALGAEELYARLVCLFEGIDDFDNA